MQQPQQNNFQSSTQFGAQSNQDAKNPFGNPFQANAPAQVVQSSSNQTGGGFQMGQNRNQNAGSGGDDLFNNGKREFVKAKRRY